MGGVSKATFYVPFPRGLTGVRIRSLHGVEIQFVQ